MVVLLSGPSYHPECPLEEGHRHRVEHVAGLARRAAGRRAGVRPLEDDAELEAGEDGVPSDPGDVAVAALAVTGDELGRRREAVPRLDGHRRAGAAAVVVGPGREEPAEVE